MTKAAKKKSAEARNTPRTAPVQERRQQLIEATIKSIAKYGMSGTTMATITGFAGLSIGLVNFHFKNKETLLEETLHFLAEEHRNQWKKSFDKADLTPKAKLLAIVDAHYHPKICSRKKLAVWFGFYGEAANRARYRDIMQKIDPERWELSIGLCQDLIEDGGYEGLEALEIADTLEGLYDGFCLNILMYPGEFTREDAKRRIRAYLASVFPRQFQIPTQS